MSKNLTPAEQAAYDQLVNDLTEIATRAHRDFPTHRIQSLPEHVSTVAMKMPHVAFEQGAMFGASEMVKILLVRGRERLEKEKTKCEH